MPKRNKLKKMTFEGEWKPVAYDQPFMMESGQDFLLDGLVEIEELTDYTFTPSSSKGKPKQKAVESEGGVVTGPASKRKMKAEKRRVERKAKRQKKKAEPEGDPTQPHQPEETVKNGEETEESEDKNQDEKGADEEIREGKSRKTDGLADEASEETEESEPSPWEQLQVSPVIVKALREMNFHKPTPIQEECLPTAIRSRKDIIGAAETGSGKTLAFGIPLLENIMADKASEEGESETHLRALVITPTRELAAQIKAHIDAVGKYTGIKTVLIVGGMFKEKQDRLLNRRPDIIIATPGRLFDHMQTQTPYLTSLHTVRYLVIDEVDRMVEHGHFRELTDILERLNSDERAAAKRQTFVFSATLQLDVDKSTQKRRPFEEGGSNDAKDRIGNISSLLGLKANAKIVDLSKPEGTAGGLSERRLPCTLKNKDYLFYYLLMMEATGRTLVFCNSLDCVRRLFGVFSYLLTETGRSPLVLHAAMHQKQRLKNLERFRENPRGVLLASDVASRGLDIPDVQCVIHYQVPRNPDLYVHRSGRTARAFKVGSSVMLVDPSDAPATQKIQRALHRETDLPTVEVDNKIFRFAQERVDVAREIDRVEHALRKEASNDEWFVKAAAESDMILDEDDEKKMNIQTEGKTRKAQSKESKSLKKQLKHLLSQPIKSRMPGFSAKYPTLNFTKQRMGLPI